MFRKVIRYSLVIPEEIKDDFQNLRNLGKSCCHYDENQRCNVKITKDTLLQTNSGSFGSNITDRLITDFITAHAQNGTLVAN